MHNNAVSVDGFIVSCAHDKSAGYGGVGHLVKVLQKAVASGEIIEQQ